MPYKSIAPAPDGLTATISTFRFKPDSPDHPYGSGVTKDETVTVHRVLSLVAGEDVDDDGTVYPYVLPIILGRRGELDTPGHVMGDAVKAERGYGQSDPDDDGWYVRGDYTIEDAHARQVREAATR